MGVPAFYRWLQEKYPKIVIDMLEKRMVVVDGIVIPLDLKEPNPNGVEYDNLYIDMNGLIHPCSHPEDREPPKTETEMYQNVTKYVDRLFAAVRPRRLVYLAIDGVAPRAKMNQQRSRRFRAAADAKERKKALEEVIEEMKMLGHIIPPERAESWDSNVITPGTEFMEKLSDYIWFYVLERINKDPAWKSIKVVFSDASEPGEGEHKIMDFIRTERSQPGYDANQKHILHGLDADLIMLALATHEVHFTILREQVFFGKRERDKPKSDAQMLLDEQCDVNGYAVSAKHPEDEWVYSKPLQCLRIYVLREYLANEFLCLQGSLPFTYDLERIIDDFVFLCFFVGNDFLPHLPSLDIRDGAIDFLIEVYKEILPALGDYLTSQGGIVNLSKVDVILGRVGEIEDEVFRRRRMAEEDENRRKKSNRQQGGPGRPGGGRSGPRPGPIANPILREPYSASHGISGTKFLQASMNTTMRVGLSREGTSSGVVTSSSITSDSSRMTTKGDSKDNGNAKANSLAAAELKKAMMKKQSTFNTLLHVLEDDTTGVTSGKRILENISINETEEVEADLGELSMPPVKYLKLETVEKNKITSERIDHSDDTAMTVTVKEEDDSLQVEQTTTTSSTSIPSDFINILVRDTGFAEMKEEDLEQEQENAEEQEEEVELTDSLEAIVPLLPPILATAVVVGQSDSTTSGEHQSVQKVIKDKLKERQDLKLDGLYESSRVEDPIRLHEEGWKQRYYEDRHKKTDLQHGGGKDRMCATYVEGLCWVFKYYYQGCPSWNWYYPFHYAPFASDLRNIDRIPIEFTLSKPFKPLEQLLAVLPPESAHALPESIRWLVTEERSPIYDIYHTEAELDPNGKHLPWLWVLLLPFIEEDRITSSIQLCEQDMTKADIKKNSFGNTLFFIHINHPLTTMLPLASTSTDLSSSTTTTTSSITISDEKNNFILDISNLYVLFNPIQGQGIAGILTAPIHSRVAAIYSRIISPGYISDIVKNEVLCLGFAMPHPRPHLSCILTSARLVPAHLTQSDLVSKRPPRLNRGFNLLDLHTKPIDDNMIQSSRGGRGYDQTMAYRSHSAGSVHTRFDSTSADGYSHPPGRYPGSGNSYQGGGGYYQTREQSLGPPYAAAGRGMMTPHWATTSQQPYDGYYGGPPRAVGQFPYARPAFVDPPQRMIHASLGLALHPPSGYHNQQRAQQQQQYQQPPYSYHQQQQQPPRHQSYAPQQQQQQQYQTSGPPRYAAGAPRQASAYSWLQGTPTVAPRSTPVPDMQSMQMQMAQGSSLARGLTPSSVGRGLPPFQPTVVASQGTGSIGGANRDPRLKYKK